MHPALADDILQAAAPIFASLIIARAAGLAEGERVSQEILAECRIFAIEQAISLRADVRNFQIPHV